MTTASTRPGIYTLDTDRRTAYCYDCGWVWEQCCCHMYSDCANATDPVAPHRNHVHAYAEFCKALYAYSQQSHLR